MADVNSQVALGINAPNPNQGLDSMSKVLGIGSDVLGLQQKKQALQLQAQQITQGQIETQAQQESNQFLSSWSPGKHHDDSGLLDIGSAQNDPGFQAMSGAGKLKVMTQLNGMQTQQLQNKTSLLKLNAEAVGQLAKVSQAASEHPEQAPALFQAFAAQGPDNAKAAGIYGPLLQKANWNPDALRTVAAQAQDISGQQSQTNVIPGTNAAGQRTVSKPRTGETALAPTSGGADVNPTAPKVAGQTTRQAKTGNADVDTSNMVVDSLRDSRANIDLTKRIDQLADVVQPGAIASKVSSGLGALGLQDVNQARTELDKDLNRLKGSLASRSESDKRAGPILDQIPDSAKPTNTIHQAMDITRGFNRQDLALGNLREKSSKATGGQMNGFQGDYAHAVSAASPLMHEYHALSPQDQVGFFQRNFKTKEEAKAFRAQAESVKKLSPDVIGQ
jgi:hypothetical protein